MKSVLRNFAVLSMGILLYSCNEKISPELENGNSTTIPSVSVPDEYYFKITNNSPTVLNFNLHRTGSGNAATECKVRSSGMALSSDLYIGDIATAHDLKNYDISCYMEAEELSLYFNGLSFGIEASKNTCEYVAYSPYSYFDGIPGNSTADYVAVECESPIGTAELAANATATGIAVGAGATQNGLTSIPCGKMVDVTVLPAASRTLIDIPDDITTQCTFNYEEAGGNGQNCDTGTLRYRTISVVDGATAPAPPMAVATANPYSTTKCGGKIMNCVEGPIKLTSATSPTYSEIKGTVLNTDFSSSYTLPALMGNKLYQHDIVNYRKGLASMDLNFLDYTVGNDANWSDTTYNKTFDPSLMEKYAANKSPDNTAILSTATITAKNQVLGYTAKPYAADPFLGVNGARVSPFYTFYCLDRAYEIKARIRMVVRDWDKVFSSTASNLELISDSYMTVLARRQDLPDNEEEFPNDPGQYNYFNDKNDWDVQIPMTRTDPNLAGVYDPGDTLWSPTPTGTYLTGWWNPSNFPYDGPPGWDGY